MRRARSEGPRTRRYHGLLLTATTPPTGRVMLVNGCDAWIETGGERFALSSQRYLPDVISPDGRDRLQSFLYGLWPRWQWKLTPGAMVTQELFVPHGISACVLTWTLAGWNFESPLSRCDLIVRPFLSGRDYHSTHHENGAFRFEHRPLPSGVIWNPYDAMPAIAALTNGTFRAEPYWYRNFLYTQERERGLDYVEDLAAPGTFTMDLREPAVLIFAAEGYLEALTRLGDGAAEIAGNLADSERKRRNALGIARSADAYLVRRKRGSPDGDRTDSGRTIIAGYPWFTDWGRDTFISLRGLCLTSWPNERCGRNPGRVGRHDLRGNAAEPLSGPDRRGRIQLGRRLALVHRRGRRFSRTQPVGRVTCSAGARPKAARGRTSDPIGLLIAERATELVAMPTACCKSGVPGEQLTWMDVRVGDWVVTPRIGKPVEVEALWLSALKIGGQVDSQWSDVYARGLKIVSHPLLERVARLLVRRRRRRPSGRAGRRNRSAQSDLRGRRTAREFARRQAGPTASSTSSKSGCGRRSACGTLDPADPAYSPHYVGGVKERDAAYHQGTVWPWLAGPFIEAWVRVRGDSAEVRAQSRDTSSSNPLERLDIARAGTSSRNRRRRSTPHTARLSVSGLVAGRIDSCAKALLGESPQLPGTRFACVDSRVMAGGESPASRLLAHSR